MIIISLFAAAGIACANPSAMDDHAVDPLQTSTPSAPRSVSEATIPAPIAASPIEQDQSSRNETLGAVPDAQTDEHAIVVAARRRHAPGDPMEAVNTRSYVVTQSVDKALGSGPNNRLSLAAWM